MTSILIVSSPLDVHGRNVAQELKARGVSAGFLDPSELGRGASINHSIGKSQSEPSIRSLDGATIRIDRVKTVWYRRPTHASIPVSVRDPNDRNFAASEWRDALDGLLFSLEASFVNPIVAQRAAVKPKQLRLAHRVGLRIPDTLISNDPVEVSEFIQNHGRGVIHKAITAPPHFFIGTERWNEDARPAMLRDLPIAPVIFQEEISGPADIRATVIGNLIFSARFAKTGDPSVVDSRLDMDVPCESWELPVDLKDKLIRLMNELGLVFGTIDLRVTDDNEYVFLEVNPQGQFLYIEILTGMPITAALAEFLAGA
jgi:glutathione synthase/RimK-type ligase-like ATP-grasp enzyme